ncbi:hypothetical protein A5904_14665 (plasmid) [Acidithiobacillus caldus]|nr:hypothetical protein [Acidithiobacillus caldus]AIA56779.1 hypothetical protein Acaty_m0206 [Acidithiobacillus caldus ATCC 51756]AUW34188.1 hypothetical protein A5904_14665 [Acidithiobacillus caldus]QER43351.1 hypothetical protein F0726_00262 [Acidithiobacillus caldus]
MRKTAVLAALCTLSLGASGLALAATNPNILAANNEIGLSVSGNLLNYQEHITPGDTESGWTPGFGVKYSLMQNLAGIHNAYVAVRFGWSRGNVAYHGFTQRPTANGVVYSPYRGTDNATMYRVIARVGMGLNIRPGAMVTPFVFGGYQHWNRHLLGPEGYTEDYHAGVVGLGAMVQDAVTRKLVLTLTPEFGAVVGGGLHTNLFHGHITPASFGTTGEEKISLSADYALSGAYGYGAGMGWHLYGGLSYTHYNYTGGPISLAYRGQTVPFGDEPFSSTNLFQVQAGVAYSF